MIDGLVVVDKEAGWTSHDVVARCRRIFGQPRVGHGGTLDPDATGVLLVGLGKMTRLLRFVAAGDKTYAGEIALGTSTSTLDASGEVTGTYDMSGVTPTAVAAAAASLTGQVEQIPPMVSARRVGGTRLHVLARRGETVERAATTVRISSFHIEEASDGVYRFAVTCSGGTYVRVLADDLGRILGGGAHLRTLRRTAVGSFEEADAVVLDKVCPGSVVPVREALRGLESCVVDGDVERAASFGRAVDPADLGVSTEGPWALVSGSGTVLAVYELDAEWARPAVVLEAAG